MTDEQAPPTPPNPEHERILDLLADLATVMTFLECCLRERTAQAEQDPGPDDHDLRAIDAYAFAHRLLDAFHTELLLRARHASHGIHVMGPPAPTVEERVRVHLRDALETLIADLARYVEDDRRDARAIGRFGRPRR